MALVFILMSALANLSSPAPEELLWKICVEIKAKKSISITEPNRPSKYYYLEIYEKQVTALIALRGVENQLLFAC
jgi:hypothetical protein